MIRRIIPWVVLVLLLGAGFVFREPLIAWGRGVWADLSGQDAEPEAGPLVASGFIEARDLDVAAAASGRIRALHIAEGQQVKAGEIAAELDTALLDAQIREAQAAIRVAEAQVAVLRAGVREAELDVARAAVGQAEAEVAAATTASEDARLLVTAPGELDVQIARAQAALQVANERASAAEAGAEAADLEQQLWGRIVSRLEVGTDVSLPPEMGGGSRHVDAPAAPLAEARLTWNLKSQAAWQAHASHNTALAAVEAARQALADLRIRKADPVALQGQASAAGAAVPVAEAEVEAARAHVAVLAAGTPAEQVLAAEAAADQARAALEALEAQRPNFTVKAPETGTIVSILLHRGEVAAAGAAIARLADLRTVTLTVYVPASRMGEVRLGGSVAVAVDAFPGRTFSGLLTHIAGEAEFTPKNVQTQAERADTVFAVKATLGNEDAALKAGMPADAVFCSGDDACEFPFASATDETPSGIGALARQVLPQGQAAPQAAQHYAGAIEASEVQVAAEVGGRAMSVSAAEGDVVVEGQVLVKLDDAALVAQRAQVEASVATARAELARVTAAPQPERVAQAQAGLAQAEAAAAAAQAQLDAARQQRERPQELDAQISGARQQVRVATAAIDSAQAAVKTAQVLQESLPNPGSDEDRTRRAMYDAQHKAAEASLRAAQAEERGAQAVVAALLAMRDNPVAFDAAVHKAEGDVQKAEAAVATARAALAQATAAPQAAAVALAEARVAQAEAAMGAIGAMLAKLEVVAPISGEVTVQALQAGEVVIAGKPLFTVADVDTVRLAIYVPMAEVGAVRLGQDVQVSVDAYPGRTFAGVVTRIAEEAEFTPKNVQTTDERARMVLPVEITLSNEDGELRPGMGAEAAF